ncbi:MAG: energy transducer TonB [Puniceicoccaceae bacterium]|nr:energy transducer TonB [Puniceicoccaceae bacterium]|tara:strand:+ start:10176 stop:12020 length:1845 start_codon:yes stop_codon:yes gene_type:complete
MRISKAVTLLLVSLASALNATDVGIPSGGEALLSKDALTRKWAYYPGSIKGEPVGEAQLIQVEHPAFQQAMRVKVLRPDGLFFSSAIQLPSTQAVRAGDTLLVHLYFRSILNTEETGNGFATVFVQGPKPEYKKYLIHEINATDEWKEYKLPVKITDDLAKGELGLFIGAGGGSKKQTWEVGGIQLLNYGDSTALSALPQTRASYLGRAPDAAWRKEANERIERHRKGDFSIQVRTADGQAIEGAEIQVRQQRHAYHFGSVITATLLTGQSETSEIYRAKVLELFNQSGTENDLKWGPWENEWGDKYQQAQTIEALQWLKERHFYTRGHVLVWPSKKHLPRSLLPYFSKGDPASAAPAAKQIVLDHIADITSATSDYLDEWDVINEPYSNHDLMDAFGNEIMVDWFKAARQNLSTQQLYLNDYAILSSGGRDRTHQQHYQDTLRYLLDKGASVNGMGMQGHFGRNPTSIERVHSILDRYHTSFPQLDIRITEFDVSTDDAELQADYTRDFLTIVFSHPATVGVQCWGFWAGAHWRPEAALYTKDWQIRPNGEQWKHLTREIWWTDLNGQSDAKGTFSGRAYYGDYMIRVRHNETIKELQFQIEKDDANRFEIQF